VEGPITADGQLDDLGRRWDGSGDWDLLGAILAVAGDVNGDGADDMIVGLPHNVNGAGGYGNAYVMYGPGDYDDVSDGDGWLTGAYGEANAVGLEVSGAGDTNGDGLDDVLVVGTYQNYSSRAVYVLLGPVDGGYTPVGADATLYTLSDNNSLGEGDPGIAGLGDTDGDGYGDVIATAYNDTSGGNPTQSGANYIVNGPLSGLINLATADARIFGDEASDIAGVTVVGPGDVDGDGTADLLMGLLSDRYGSNSGATALVPGPFRGTHDLSEVATAYFYGADATSGAYRPRAVGDLRGDGVMDFAVGASGGDGDEAASGLVSVYHGGGF
jgi:hypothetical protein